MSKEKPNPGPDQTGKKAKKPAEGEKPKEFGGFENQNLPEPTRYGDWEVKGRCSDF